MQRVGVRLRGFTIVELLIVIVVIAILAAITLIAYNGIRERAQVSAVQSAVSQGVKKILAYAALNADTYPADAAAAGLSSDSNATYYVSRIGAGYCITASTQGLAYFQTREISSPVPGTCEGMLAWWPLNGDANDKSGNGVDGAVVNASLSVGQNGQSDGAYRFTTNGQYISMGVPASFASLSTGLTYSIWAMYEGNATTQWPVVMGSTDPHARFAIRGSQNGAKLYVEWGEAPYDGSQWTGTGSTSADLLPTGSWHHFAVTFDGVTMKSYLDGAMIGQRSATLNPNQAAFYLNNGGGTFIGRLDDARVFGRALTSSEVQTMYQTGAQ